MSFEELDAFQQELERAQKEQEEQLINSKTEETKVASNKKQKAKKGN